MRDDYLQRWLTVLQTLPSSKKQKHKIYDDLKRRYAESHRAYHTFEHIKACLQQLDKVSNTLENALHVELALWFHDVIYNPRSESNEVDSAEYAKQALQTLALSEEAIQVIEHLILLTQHPSQPQTYDEQILLDIDLSILGAEKSGFALYNENIRREYRWVDDVIYQKERAKVLANFLAQTRIYHTKYFFDKKEILARKNLVFALESCACSKEC